MVLKPSVIIPARNRADILPETLRALARQSFPAAELEVVVVDDGSTDDTAARLGAGDYPFRLVCERLEPREGFCPARPRNHGLHVATGDIAILLDADLVACPELVSGHLTAHETGRPPQAVIGYTYGYPLEPADRTPEALDPPPPDRLLDVLPDLVARDAPRWGDGREPIYAASSDLADHPAPWQLFWTSNVSVPRLLAVELGGFDEEFVGWGVEDLEFAYRLHQRGVRFALARQACGAHYPHPVGDLEERGCQRERNRRRLIAKHPEPELELRLWDARACAGAWEALAPLRDRPRPVPAVGLPAVTALLDRLEADVFPPGPRLWCGAAPAALAVRRLPAAWCRPFPAAGDEVASGEVLPLLGIYTPWSDGTFAAGILWDGGYGLPPDLQLARVREVVRVAGCAALLGAEGAAARHLPLPKPDEIGAALAALTSEYAWEVVRQGDLTALLVYRPPWRGKRMSPFTQQKPPSANGSRPIAATIAATVARSLREQRQIDAFAATVLQRLRERSAPAPVPEEDAPPASTNGASSLREDLALPEPAPPEPAQADVAAPVEAAPLEPLSASPVSLELNMALQETAPSRPVGAHPLVAPLGTRDCQHSWQGRLTRKPWEYRITAVLPHLETPEPLRAAVELLRLQTKRPYLLVIDTGSSESVKAALEAMRAEDLEVHYVAAHGYLHSSEAVGVAQDLAFALCRSEYLFCTHADCFLRRRDYLEWLLSLCGPETPAVGYQMSPRDWITDLWRGMISHTGTLLHMPTMHRHGITWSFERAHVQFGISREQACWPDTETCMNLCLRAAGIQPLLISSEENFKRHVDENLDHVRSYPGSLVYKPEYHARAREWMEEALREAWQRVTRWRATELPS